MPASFGSAIAYSHMLESTGLPHTQAHAAFEQALDAPPPAPNGRMTKEQQRAALTHGIVSRGEDAHVQVAS